MGHVRVLLPVKEFYTHENCFAVLTEDNANLAEIMSIPVYSSISRFDIVSIEKTEEKDKYVMKDIDTVYGETYLLFCPPVSNKRADEIMDKLDWQVECFSRVMDSKQDKNNVYWGLSVELGDDISELREKLFSLGFVSPQLAENMDQVTFMRHRKLAMEIIEKYKLKVMKERMYGYKSAQRKQVRSVSKSNNLPDSA